jgi:DNA-binding CsgD family transcriptional regulator
MEGCLRANTHRRLTDETLADRLGPAAARPKLTPRQLECLKWVGEGKSSTDIGSILELSPATVDGHIADACIRLGVRTRIQAIVEAFRNGWLR